MAVQTFQNTSQVPPVATEEYLQYLERKDLHVKNNKIRIHCSPPCTIMNSCLYSTIQVDRGHKSSSVLYDYCDGEFFTKHPLFPVHGDALQILLYYDELKTCWIQIEDT